VLPEVFRKIAGLRLPELQLLIEDRQELAEVQHIDSVLVKVPDDLVNPLMRERDQQLPVQFRKFAPAEELIARRGNFGMDRFVSSLVAITQESEAMEFSQI
jgi:hypothetical protein